MVPEDEPVKVEEATTVSSKVIKLRRALTSPVGIAISTTITSFLHRPTWLVIVPKLICFL